MAVAMGPLWLLASVWGGAANSYFRIAAPLEFRRRVQEQIEKVHGKS